MNFDYMAHLGDTAYLQKQINENDEIIIPRENPLTGDNFFLIRRRLVLDSNKTVILDGAHLRLDDGVFEQIFTTEPEMGMDHSPKENIKIIGKNGAGKTTAMKAILGLLKVDAGEISVCGERVAYGQTATNRLIGYLPDVPEFYSFMTAPEYLKFCGEITGMSNTDIKAKSGELLELVGLDGEKHRIGGFSRGMKQRLGIAQALINSPRLLICDEPTSALDIETEKIVAKNLSALEDKTLVIISHKKAFEEYSNNKITISEGKII